MSIIGIVLLLISICMIPYNLFQLYVHMKAAHPAALLAYYPRLPSSHGILWNVKFFWPNVLLAKDALFSSDLTLDRPTKKNVIAFRFAVAMFIVAIILMSFS